MTWKWPVPPDHAVTTTTAVLEDGAPVRCVRRDIVGETWFFLEGAAWPNPSTFMGIDLELLLDIEPSLETLSDLPPGWNAFRDEDSARWSYAPEFSEDWDTLCRHAEGALLARRDTVHERFSLSRWDGPTLDLIEGHALWRDAGEVVVHANAQVVGALAEGVWSWSWADAAFEGAAGRMETLRIFGQNNDHDALTQPRWEATEDDGWRMAALACYLLDAWTAHRVPRDAGGFAFVVLNRYRWAEPAG